jgi:hypothetical protein
MNLISKRGDEKRRDFEHGWEQCEVSHIILFNFPSTKFKN